MKIAFRLLGAIGILIGTIWILQGVNILPGSFMSGQMKWAVNGAIAAIIGAALIIGSFFFKKKPS
jgi:hypothetical protein